MNREIFKSIISQEPKAPADKYLFLVDTVELAENIYLAGFKSLALIENDELFFGEVAFTDYLDTIIMGGTWLTSYCFIPCMKRRADNEFLENYFDLVHLQYEEGLKIFYQKAYLKKPEKVNQLKAALTRFIDQCEGPAEDPADTGTDPGELQPVNAADLVKMDIPPISWLVEDLLPEGLAMLGAPSKTYKSYMALHLCLCVAEGQPFMKHQTTKAACLYCDLESTKRRPRNRLQQILKGDPAPANFEILTALDGLKKIGEGFEDQIENYLSKHPDIKLVVVDVFQMIRKAAKYNQTGYDRDYDDFQVLKGIADRHNICLLLIHHTRKMRDPSDVFNDLSGSVGVMGALDAAWVIGRDDRFDDEATLNITGRDMESRKLKIRFNKQSFKWEYIGTSEEVALQRLREEYENSPITETIKKLIKQGGGSWEGSAKEIRDAGQYLSRGIYDDVARVGKFISSNIAYFHEDGIEIDRSRLTTKRSMKFEMIN